MSAKPDRDLERYLRRSDHAVRVMVVVLVVTALVATAFLAYATWFAVNTYSFG